MTTPARSTSRHPSGLITLALAIVLPLTAHAAPPGLESIFPAGGKIGTTFEINVAGAGLEKDSPGIWCSAPGVTFQPGAKPKTFTVTLAADAKPGPCLIRLHTSAGSTPPRIFHIGTLDEFAELEPNDVPSDLKKAEPRANTTFNGTLAKAGDIDTYPIRLQKGKTVQIMLHGYSLGSPMDPALRLLDSRGIEIASGHDTHNLDPRIEHTPAQSGTYFVQVLAFAHPPAADVSLKGSANHIYRLSLAEKAPAEPPKPEPAQITAPVTLRGILSKPKEEDIFSLQAKKGEEWALSLLSEHFDTVLRIDDSTGKTLTQSDDIDKDTSNSALRWKVAKDGEVKIIVADRFHGGSPAHSYELSVQPATASITATLDTHAYLIEPGKSTDIKLAIKITGTPTTKLTAQAQQLPPGITAAPLEIPAKGGELKLTLKAAPDALPSQTPIRIEILGTPQPTTATYTIPFTEPRGPLLISQDPQPWLTVTAAKKK